MGPHRRKKKNKNGGGPAPGGSGRDCYRRRRWGAGDDSSTTTGGSGKLRGEKYGPSVESTTEASRDCDIKYVMTRMGIDNTKFGAHDAQPLVATRYISYILDGAT